MFWKTKYLKYKKKYINYKNKLLNLYGGGKPEYYEVKVEGSEKSVTSHEILEALMKYNFTKERIIMNNEQALINNLIDNFFTSERFLLLINSIIKDNIQKLNEHIKELFGLDIENINMEIGKINESITGVKKGLAAVKLKNDITRINEQEQKLCDKEKSKAILINNYKLSILINDVYKDFFKT